MKTLILAPLLSLFLSACFESPSDLIGTNANTIVRIDSILSLNNQIYYTQGSGKKIQLCQLSVRADLKLPCKSAGMFSAERTSRGNYIVQFLSSGDHKYGIWFRSDEGSPGKAGLQCFLWLGDGIVGNTTMSGVAVNYGGTELFEKLSSAVRRVGTERPINRKQLLRIVSVYEDTLSPLVSGEVRCLGNRIWIDPKNVEIVGDIRHLQQFEPGSPPPL